MNTILVSLFDSSFNLYDIYCKIILSSSNVQIHMCMPFLPLALIWSQETCIREGILILVDTQSLPLIQITVPGIYTSLRCRLGKYIFLIWDYLTNLEKLTSLDNYYILEKLL